MFGGSPLGDKSTDRLVCYGICFPRAAAHFMLFGSIKLFFIDLSGLLSFSLCSQTMRESILQNSCSPPGIDFCTLIRLVFLGIDYLQMQMAF